ncbi:trinucleotide repeat-containing gene 18 protein-like, partial [Canis lupus familiaris]|uniref:trinucleotide repeat-containing gene 18 protein-like n=1 Tax=Canis lupus familiaris TaxID=9615 RepID=UPI0018F50664
GSGGGACRADSQVRAPGGDAPPPRQVPAPPALLAGEASVPRAPPPGLRGTRRKQQEGGGRLSSPGVSSAGSTAGSPHPPRPGRGAPGAAALQPFTETSPQFASLSEEVNHEAKRKRKHLERTSSPQTVKRSKDNTLVPEAKGESSESEYFSCYSSLSHLSSAGISKSSKFDPPPGHCLEDNTLVTEAKGESSESEYFSCYSSFSLLSSAGISKSSKFDPPTGPSLEDNTLICEAKGESFESKYFGYSFLSRLFSAGISKSSKFDPPPGPSLEDNTLVPVANGESSESEYFSCYSSLSHLSSAEILKKQKDTPQPGESTSQEEHSAVVSSDLPCASDNKNTEVLNTDEDILLSGPSGLAQGHSQRAEVSDSEYISRISPADKLFDRGNMVGVEGLGGNQAER